MTHTDDIKALIRREVKEAVRSAIGEYNAANSLFPTWDTRAVAKALRVSVSTVRDWHKQGLLEAHYHLLSGRATRLLFTNRELCRFFAENFPSDADLRGSPFHPKSSKAQRIRSLLAMGRLLHRRRQPPIPLPP